MAKQMQNPRLGTKYRPGEKRLMNKDGTFNVHKIGIPIWAVKLLLAPGLNLPAGLVNQVI